LIEKASVNALVARAVAMADGLTLAVRRPSASAEAVAEAELGSTKMVQVIRLVGLVPEGLVSTQSIDSCFGDGEIIVLSLLKIVSSAAVWRVATVMERPVDVVS